MTERKKRLGEILVEGKFVTLEQFQAAVAHQRQWGGKIGSALIEKGFITEEQMVKVLSAQLGVPGVCLSKLTVAPDVMAKIPRDLQEKHLAMPIAVVPEKNREAVVLAIANPRNVAALDEITFATGLKVKQVVVACEIALKRLIFGGSGPKAPEPPSKSESDLLMQVFLGSAEPGGVLTHDPAAEPTNVIDPVSSDDLQPVEELSELEPLPEDALMALTDAHERSNAPVAFETPMAPAPPSTSVGPTPEAGLASGSFEATEPDSEASAPPPFAGTEGAPRTPRESVVIPDLTDHVPMPDLGAPSGAAPGSVADADPFALPYELVMESGDGASSNPIAAKFSTWGGRAEEPASVRGIPESSQPGARIASLSPSVVPVSASSPSSPPPASAGVAVGDTRPAPSEEQAELNVLFRRKVKLLNALAELLLEKGILTEGEIKEKLAKKK